MDCEICAKSLPTDGDYPTCGRCKTGMHSHCAGLQRSTWKGKSLKKRSEWECVKCRPPVGKSRTGSVDQDEEGEVDEPTFLALKKLLETMFKKQEDAIIGRVNNIVTLVSKLEDTINKLIDRVQIVENNASELRKEIEDIRLDLECEKQYGRSKNFIVTSIPFTANEDVPDKIIGLLKEMNIELKKEEITAHRLPSPRSPAPIVVQCTTRATRDSVVRRSRKLKPTTSLISNNLPQRAIFFNDHMTPYFSELMRRAKEAKDKCGFKYIWLNGNRIMMKKNNESKAIKIVRVQDIDKVA